MKRNADKTVTVICRAEPRKGARRHSVKVTAGYYRIVDGALIFRSWRGPDQYPETIHVFAPGHWLEVKR